MILNIHVVRNNKKNQNIEIKRHKANIENAYRFLKFLVLYMTVNLIVIVKAKNIVFK